jgi:Domain of unknown function (DUF5668)/Cell wall-active antibiotics response 4TMS YvqF
MNPTDRQLIQQDLSSTNAPPAKKAQRHHVLWPYMLIFFGVLFLLENLGVRTGSVWNAVETGWPLILIVIGADLLSRPYAWGRPLTLGLALLTGAVMVIWGFARPARVATTETISQPITAARAEITLGNTVGRLEVSANSTGKLIDGTLELGGHDRLVRALDTRDGVQIVRLEAVTDGVSIGVPDLISRNSLGWKIGLAQNLPLVLRVKTGVGSGNLELSELKVTDLTVNSGVGQMTVTLPTSGRVIAHIEGGVGNLSIVIPRAMQAQIRVSSGLGQVSVNGDYQRDSDVYTSSGFENANNRVELEIKGGVGRVSVEPSGR